MTDAPSRRVALFGTEERVAPPKIFRAGPLTAELDQGNLRYLRFAGVEALRAVAFLVRDRHWATYAPTLSNLKIGQGSSSFSISYDATCSDESQSLRYSAKITGRSDGTLTFEVKGVAETDFLTNRLGFIVLHPLDGVAGEPVTVTHTDGTVEEARFSREISPAQPFFDIRSLGHEVVPGVFATCTMEGDAFEMEDHRNWTDASYKTYIRPLSKPRPFTLSAGERFEQRVTLAFRGRPGKAAAGAEDRVRITLGEPLGVLPRIGLFLPPEEAEASLVAADLLRAIGPQLLVGRLDLRDPAPGDGLRDLKALSDALGASVMLEVVLPNRRPPVEELGEAAARVQGEGLDLEAVHASPHEYLKSWQPRETWPNVPPLETIYDAAREAFPGALIGGGMLSYFTELNRKRPPVAHCDFISHTTCPIVHDADDRAVMETLEALPWVALSVRALAGGKPYRVGPSTIGMRQNPYGGAPVDNPDSRRLAMAFDDPRQRGLFGAAWNFGYAARLAPAGVEVLTLSAPVGAFGVAYRKTSTPQPWFDERGEGIYPLYHVIRGLARAAGRQRLETRISDGSAVQALGWRDGSGTVLWLANLTGAERAVMLDGLPAEVARVTTLDLASFAAAASGPDGLADAATTGPAGSLKLGPYAVVRLEIGG